MPFYVHGQDRQGVKADMLDLAEAHWSYMDRFADRLILRGPTLSDDGVEHTGSIHVIDVADRVSAERFATEEPYWLAGLYRRVTTVRAVVLLLRREPTEGSPTVRAPHALITGEWPRKPRNTRHTEEGRLGMDLDSRVRFVAVLVDDNQSHSTGIVSVVRALPAQAAGIIGPSVAQLTGEHVTLTAQRWQRGGRS